MIPGSNLLNLALTVIGRQWFDYYRFKSRAPNRVGLDVTIYELPVNLSGSVQPVLRELYEKFELDLQRDYMTFYVSKDVMDVARDVSGDQMFFNGKIYQCMSITNWFPMDGWVPVLCVAVPDVA